jgi:hypothetical protein
MQWRIYRACWVCTGIPCNSSNFKYMHTYLCGKTYTCMYVLHTLTYFRDGMRAARKRMA